MTEAQKKEHQKQQQKHEEAATSSQGQAQPPFQLPNLTGAAASHASLAPKPQAAPKGKLKIPKKTESTTTKEEQLPKEVEPQNETEKTEEASKESPPFEPMDAQPNEELESLNDGQQSTEKSLVQSTGEDKTKEEVDEEHLKQAQVEENAPERHENETPQEGSPNQEFDSSSEKKLSEKVAEGDSGTATEAPLGETTETGAENSEDEQIDQPVAEEETNEEDTGVELQVSGDFPDKLEEKESQAGSGKEEDKESTEDAGDGDNTDEATSELNEASPVVGETNQHMDRGDSYVSEPSKESSATEEAREVQQKLASMAVSEEVMEKFTLQLQRLEENFQIERQDMERQHALALQQAFAAKDDEVKQFQSQLKEKDKQVRELLRAKEGSELRMDSLQREVEGTKELLQKK